MTESYLFSFTYALQMLYWVIVYGLAGYAIKHAVETKLTQRHATAADTPNRAKPKRRG